MGLPSSNEEGSARSDGGGEDIHMLKALTRLLLLAVVLAAGPVLAAESRDPEDHFFNLNTGDLKAELADARSAGKSAILVMFEETAPDYQALVESGLGWIESTYFADFEWFASSP